MPSPSDAAELQALFEGVEAARKDVEATWGAERLPIIVGDDWRVKLRRQQAKLSAALQEAWAADAVTGDMMGAARSAAAAMVRGWAKLGSVASEAGHRPLHGGVLGERMLPDGSVCAFVRDNDAAAQVIAEGRCLVVYTLDELAYLIGTLVPESLTLAKVHFPGAKFEAAAIGVGSREWVKRGDELPDFTAGQRATA